MNQIVSTQLAQRQTEKIQKLSDSIFRYRSLGLGCIELITAGWFQSNVGCKETVKKQTVG